MSTYTKSYAVTKCEGCPFWSRHSMDGCECTHPEAPGNYGNLVGPYEAAKNPPPKWCPLRISPYKETKTIYLK